MRERLRGSTTRSRCSRDLADEDGDAVGDFQDVHGATASLDREPDGFIEAGFAWTGAAWSRAW
jgi:hypothetical protein